MGITTIMGHLDRAKKDLCFRTTANLRNQGVTVAELRAQCQKRGWFCVEHPDRIWIAKSEDACSRVPSSAADSGKLYDLSELPEAERLPQGAKQTLSEDARSRVQHTAADGGKCSDPNELPEPELLPEGAREAVIVNRYERNASARTACIQHWGLDCTVCGFNFEATFGKRGAGYIHVHHLKPLGEIGGEYQLDPVNDLRPVCPNCHAMLHASTPAASIEELKDVRRRCDG